MSALPGRFPDRQPMKSERRALLFGLVSVACWSTVATAFKLSLRYIDTWQLLFYSTLTATLALLCVVVLRQGVPMLTESFRQHKGLTLVAGLLNPVVYYIILFKAYELLPAQVAQPINYTWSIVLVLMAIIFLNQKVRARDLIAAGICYGGVFIIATRGQLDAFRLHSSEEFAGIGLALLSTFVWAGYWILNIRDPRERTIGLCLNFIVALPVTLLLCVGFSTLAVPLMGLLGAIYVGLVEMAIAFLFWSAALRLTDNAARVGNLIFLSPLVSLFIIHRVLGETIHPGTLVGLILIISGLLFQRYAPGRPRI